MESFWIIKNIFKYIYISPFLVLFAFVAIIIGSFIPFLLITYLVFIHELGHFIVAKRFNVKLDKICLYPFGGISRVDSKINIPLKHELIILISGPLFQEIGYIILLLLLKNKEEIELLTIYNFSILFFNLLPIYPLDGGKILNNLIAHKISYLSSINFSIVISLVLSIILLSLCLKINFNINIFMMFIFLLYQVRKTYLNKSNSFNRFILERYLYNFNFTKRKTVKNEKLFTRDYKHIIKNNHHYYTEKEYLKNKFH